MRVGLFLSSEEYGPHELVEQARQAAGAGMTGLWVSDDYHPWIDAQGQSPFVGAVSQACDAPVGPHYQDMITMYAQEIVPNLA